MPEVVTCIRRQIYLICTDLDKEGNVFQSYCEKRIPSISFYRTEAL